MTALSLTELLLLIIVSQQSVAAPLWALCGRLRVAPVVPALHWSGAAALTAITLSMPLWPGGWQGHVLANLLAPGIFLLLRLGLQILFRGPRHDGEHAVLVALAVSGTLGGQLLHAPGHWFVVLSSALNAWSLLRTVQVVDPLARQEFGASGARLVLWPLLATGLLFVGRGLAAVAVPQEVGAPLEQVTPTNLVLLSAMMTFGLLAHLSVGLAVSLRLMTKMRHLSRVDSLTQLPNRRAADEMLAQLLRDGRERGHEAVLLAIDADHFKRINDEHGHHVGDRALVHLARLLRQGLRVSDVLARVGGEELLVLLPETDEDAALELAERLRTAVEAAPLRVGSREQPMTVSIGVARLGASVDAANWLQRADAAMYQAKREGRNRVCVADAGDERHG